MSKRQQLIKRYRKAMDSASEYLAAPVVKIYYYSDAGTDCPVCEWDPINQESVDQDCPVCSGIGKVRTLQEKTINAIVSARGIQSKYELEHLPAGLLEHGDYLVSCKADDVLLNSSARTGDTLFHIAQYVTVNDQRCQVSVMPIPQGLAGDIYRFAVVLKIDTSS